MCDIENLIDLTGCDDPIKDETVVEDAPTGSDNFKEPYDPFDLIEKEVCFKGEQIKCNMQPMKAATGVDILIDFGTNNETPAVVMEPQQASSDANRNQSIGNETRHRTLLQLAKLNAAKLSGINSPMQNKPTDFSFVESCMMCENLQMIAAESPIKLIEDEPTPIPIKSPSTELLDDACSNTEFEERLKKLRIALLDLPAKTETSALLDCGTTPITTTSITTTNLTAAPTNLELTPTTTLQVTPTTTVVSSAPTPRTVNLSSPMQTINMEKVAKILQELKSLVAQHVEPSKRDQFNVLLESLGATIHFQGDDSSQTKESPIMYTRQGTFDLDLELQKRKAEANNNIQKLPDIMTCSSSTYDAESVDKPTSSGKEDVFGQLSANITQNKRDAYVTEVVNDNLALQINEIFERHNLTNLKLNTNDHQQHESDPNHVSAGGQTVILVVNSRGSNPIQNCGVPPSTANAIQTVINDSKENTLRRRSSSLSIHDKAKQDRAKSLVKQSSGDGVSNNNMPLKELSHVGDKLNAMTSFRQRRNSFSIGTTAGAAAAGAANMQGRSHMIGRTKVAAISESSIKLNVSTKANIPVKRVVPMVKASQPTTADVTNINLSAMRCNIQDTPITSKGRGGTKLFCTSTPMPQTRLLQRRSLKPISSYANTCASTASARAANNSRKAAQ